MNSDKLHGTRADTSGVERAGFNGKAACRPPAMRGHTRSDAGAADPIVRRSIQDAGRPFTRATAVVLVTLTVQTLVAFVIASVVFDGMSALLAGFAGSMLMFVVGLPSLLAAVFDIAEDGARSTGHLERAQPDRRPGIECDQWDDEITVFDH